MANVSLNWIKLDNLLIPNQITQDHYSTIVELSKKFSEPGHFRIWMGTHPVVFIYKPQLIELVLSSASHVRKSSFYDFFAPWLGEGLLIAEPNRWRSQRHLLTPSFSNHLMDSFVDRINDNSKIMIDVLERKSKSNVDGRVEDIFSDFKMVCLDIICETAMGVKLSAQLNPTTKYVQGLGR